MVPCKYFDVQPIRSIECDECTDVLNIGCMPNGEAPLPLHARMRQLRRSANWSQALDDLHNCSP